jgi:hypothetical protein
MNKVLEAARIATLAPDPVVQAARIAALSPSLGYPDTKLITCMQHGWRRVPVIGKVWRSGNPAHTWVRGAA